MGSYTYPVKHPEGTLTTEQLHLLLSSPSRIALRVADISTMRFIADFLLQGRFDATGGGVFYETGEDAFAGDPQMVAPAGEYPKTILFEGDTVAAATKKWGIETDITDEKVARQGISYVNKSLVRVSNSIIRRVDGIAMAVIAAKVTSTFTSPETWTTAGRMVRAITAIRNTRADLGLGIDLNTVVLTPTQYATVVGILIDDKALPREAGNPAISGQIPVDALGLTWATTPHYTGANPLLVDREQLGGMADELLNSPDYAASGQANIDIHTRREGNDTRIVRGRRVTVPVVTDPLAGVQLVGSGL